MPEIIDVIDERLSEGWKVTIHDPDEKDHISHTEWSIIPCPNCNDGIVLGIEDPDRYFEGRRVTFVTLTPPEGSNA